jgi:hypothetical protein
LADTIQLYIHIDITAVDGLSSGVPSAYSHKDVMMLHRCLQKFAALVLVLVVLILTTPPFCMCQEIHAEDHLLIECSHASGHDSIGECSGHCPGCPADSDQESGHDASACYCSCHLPVTAQQFQIYNPQLVSDLVIFEPFTALPEVYLPKFIPPQNLA